MSKKKIKENWKYFKLDYNKNNISKLFVGAIKILFTGKFIALSGYIE